MKKLDELAGKLSTAIEAQRSGIRNEISNLQAQIDIKNAEIGSQWQMLGWGILIWAVVLGIAISIGNAQNIITVLWVLLSFLVLYIGSPILVIAAIIVIFNSISKGVTISSLKSEISSRKATISKLDNDIRKLH